jgi:flavin reductase (DIM6/NTAB) family NADH-FMN oxidoreductase RutF
MTLTAKNDEIRSMFRSVMRRLAGGVSIITVGKGEDISGMTVTSLTSLSADPPCLIVSINRSASSFPLIERYQVFGVNILGSDQHDLADRFSNGKLGGRRRFNGLRWQPGLSGVPLLTQSQATVECRVDEIIIRHSHGIIIGSPLQFDLSQARSGLAYWNGKYIEMTQNGVGAQTDPIST